MNFLFSIITPIYKTPTKKLNRLYNSLLEQTHSNWEWIVFDDSPSEFKEQYNFIQKLSHNDNRIKLYSENRNIGIIGEVKNKAFSYGNGDVLVEVDHDDELVNTCLENLNIAYNYSSDIGFVYGNVCEIYEDAIDGDDIIDYGDNWGFGYGSYEKIKYKNIGYKVAISPEINSETIRHITGIPNHVRTWKKETYKDIGGHNKRLQVADDFELVIKTFLKTTIAKINVFTYIQYFERQHTNTQFIKNEEIQKLVNITANFYNHKIHNRLIELGIKDTTINEAVNITIPIELLKSNNIINVNTDDKYGYSRVYDIGSTLKYTKTPHYNNIIKWLVILTNCKNYLELGVEYGLNINEIKDMVDLCVGVDINKPENIEGVDFFEMETDNFFKINKKKFDIIFIDANHNYTQVKIDFNNSLNILNKFGIIIIHDTDPITQELTESNYCHNSYKIVDYVSKNKELNIITLPIQETGLSLVMRKNDRRINNFL